MKTKPIGLITAGALTGLVTGIFSAGGGMILVPLLGLLTDLKEEEIFPASITIVLSNCLICLGSAAWQWGLPLKEAFPYLIGSAIGGFLAGKWGQKIPAGWLHRGLGILVLWGGIRYLW